VYKMATVQQEPVT